MQHTKKDWRKEGEVTILKEMVNSAGLIEKETFEYLSGSYLREEWFWERKQPGR